MPDLSDLDSKYFVDDYVYNSPFCNRRNVSYTVRGKRGFDWTENKKCYVYFVTCHSCGGTSMHLSFDDIELIATNYQGRWRFDIDEGEDIDQKFFYSVPTSFFSIDNRIPRILRELMTEAEGCLKSNFLTGASTCTRKIIYELARIEKAVGNNYEERIKSLKELRKDVDEEFFSTLLTIQQVASNKVHEKSYDGWESKHLRLMLSTLKEILDVMYVLPELRKEKRKSIIDLKQEILGAENLDSKEDQNV